MRTGGAACVVRISRRIGIQAERALQVAMIPQVAVIP